MGKPFKKIQYSLVFVLFFGAQDMAQAGGRHIAKKKHPLALSIKEAVTRSNNDQDRIKDRLDDEANERAEAWRSRQMEAIQIKHTGTSSIEAADIGAPVYSEEDLGEDSSGLNRLRTDVEDEPIDSNFDEELREISSMKD